MEEVTHEQFPTIARIQEISDEMNWKGLKRVPRVPKRSRSKSKKSKRSTKRSKRSTKRSKTKKSKSHTSPLVGKIVHRVRLPGQSGHRIRWITGVSKNGQLKARAPKIGVMIRDLKKKRNSDFGPERVLPKGTIVPKQKKSSTRKKFN